MAKHRNPYPPEFRAQIVELVKAGRTPGELARRDVRTEHLIRSVRRKVVIQQIRRDRQRVPGIGRDVITALVSCPDAVLAHQTFHARLAGRKPACANLLRHARRPIGALELGMDGTNQRKQLGIGEPLARGGAAALPGAIAVEKPSDTLRRR